MSDEEETKQVIDTCTNGNDNPPVVPVMRKPAGRGPQSLQAMFNNIKHQHMKRFANENPNPETTDANATQEGQQQAEDAGKQEA